MPATMNPTPNASSVPCHHDPVPTTASDSYRKPAPITIRASPAAVIVLKLVSTKDLRPV